jgi:hypothetical protein
MTAEPPIAPQAFADACALVTAAGDGDPEGRITGALLDELLDGIYDGLEVSPEVKAGKVKHLRERVASLVYLGAYATHMARTATVAQSGAEIDGFTEEQLAEFDNGFRGALFQHARNMLDR